MINQFKVSHTEQYKTNIAFLFLLSFLFFQPLLKYFNPERILLTSECGFGHVPIEITRLKLKKLVEIASILRKKY